MQRLRQIERYWHTIRFLRPRQIASRVGLRARAVARGLTPERTRRRHARRAERTDLTWNADPWWLRDALGKARAWMPPHLVRAAEQEAADIARGVFTFLNDRRGLGTPVDWSVPGASQLWRYHLHYFDYLPDLVVARASSDLTRLVTDWIAHTPMAEASTRDAWHPYVVSVRLVNWMLAIAASPADVEWPQPVVESLKVQTLFLRDNLETDVGGNHLLKNLKALAIAGRFWGGSEASRMRERFTGEFVDALAAQLRSDGGHFEQSPMYHSQVLVDAIELGVVLRLCGERTSATLDHLVERMETFLNRVCHPDGQLAQFGDTASGMTPDPAAIHAVAQLLYGGDPGPELTARHALLAARPAGTAPSRPPIGARLDRDGLLPSGEPPRTWDPTGSGFVVLATADTRGFLIADAGPVCPDELPAHGHSDLFGFELSVDAHRFVVDSGVSDYSAGAWRDYYRSTRAHSTVMVDGYEQSDCWDSFRVARRARVVGGRFEAGPNVRGFSAAHTGFDHLASPVRHARRILLVAERFWLVIDDLAGAGVHEWSTFLHLHPEVELHPGGESCLIAARDTARLGIAWFGIAAPRCATGERDPLQGWYAPAFGRALPSTTLVCASSGRLPVRFGWLLAPGAAAHEPLRVDRTDDGGLVVQVGREAYAVMLDAHAGIQAARTGDATGSAADR